MHHSVCLFHKNENEFLDEWLDHYKGLGFVHFFIYDNNSDVLPKNQDDVTVRPWKDKEYGRQSRAYQHFLNRNMDKTDWCLFVDTDEFLHLKKHDNISQFTSEYSEESCVVIPRLNYGSSFKKRVSRQKDLKRHGPLDHYYNYWGKSIIQTKLIKSIQGIHTLNLKKAVDVNKKRVKKNQLQEIDFDTAYIKHYVTRGTEQLEEKLQRGPGDNTKETKRSIHYSNWDQYTEWLRDQDKNVLNMYEE